MIQWKLGCRSRKQKRKTRPIARPGIEHCNWFILPVLLATPTMQFSLDRKRWSHKQNQRSASDSVGFIFTRSYRSALLITTLTTTPSLVKTSLKCGIKLIVELFLWASLAKKVICRGNSVDFFRSLGNHRNKSLNQSELKKQSVSQRRKA